MRSSLASPVSLMRQVDATADQRSRGMQYTTILQYKWEIIYI